MSQRPERREAVLAGFGLHTGAPARVRLAAAPELPSIVFSQGSARVPLETLEVVRADRGVRVASAGGALSIDTVEHLLAALGGLGVRRGLLVEVEGPEMPLLDGGARLFSEALSGLDLPADPWDGSCGLVVTEQRTIEIGRSVYEFSPARAGSIAVKVEFRAPVGVQTAHHWLADRRGFLASIAPARTFGWADEYEALRAAGRAAGVDLDGVLVFDDEGVLAGCRPPEPDEIARHKLLDVIGDFALYGGPPSRGSVTCERPGHAATQSAVREALARGVLRPSRALPEPTEAPAASRGRG